jgi:hypothetical protein
MIYSFGSILDLRARLDLAELSGEARELTMLEEEKDECDEKDELSAEDYEP